MLLAAPASADPPVVDVRPLVGAPAWRLFAVELARSSGVPARRLIQDAEPDERVAMSFYFFVAVGHGRVVLVDCGSDALLRAGMQRRWSIARAVSVEAALEKVGLSPGDVTDVVLTHHHWDHVGGLGLFSRATVHVHRGEWERVPSRVRRDVEADGRVDFVSGARDALWPGLSVREAGLHTRHHLMVELRCRERRVILAGDAAYLYRNIAERRAVAVTASPSRNVADVAEAAREVGAANVVPGHDPAVFERYPSPGRGVAAICR